MKVKTKVMTFDTYTFNDDTISNTINEFIDTHGILPDMLVDIKLSLVGAGNMMSVLIIYKEY